MPKRVLLLVVIAFVAVATGVSGFAPSAQAQPQCAEGELVGDQCRIEGDAPVQTPSRCPVGGDVKQDGGLCYREVSPVLGQCPVGSFPIGGTCGQHVDLVSDGPICPQTGFELVGDRCFRFVPPTCGPQGCVGKVTVNYAVECVGTGVAKLVLGEIVATLGAEASLITLNGSPVIGAELRAGDPVNVVVTPRRQGDIGMAVGPTVAPPCGIDAEPTAVPATPTPTPTAAPAPTTPPAPAPTVAPAATAAPAAGPTVTPEPEPTKSASLLPRATVAPTPTQIPTATPPPTEVPATAPATPAPPVETPDVPTPAPAAVTTEVQATTATAATETTLPIVPLAMIAGGTIVLGISAWGITRK